MPFDKNALFKPKKGDNMSAINTKIKTIILTAISAAILSACGGGGGEDHAFGYAEFCHFARGEVGDGDDHAAVQFGRIRVRRGDAGEDDAFFKTEIEVEFQKFGAAFDGFAVQYFGDAHVDFHKVVKACLFGDFLVFALFGGRRGCCGDALFVGIQVSSG